MIILQQTRGLLSSGDQLSLDLQFAADKTLTARKGPTPAFTRASTATYFGQSSINVEYTYGGDTYSVNLSQDQVVNGRWQWANGDTQVYFAATYWILTHDSNLVATSAPTTSWRPDDAYWSGTGATVTTGNTFGIVGAAVNEPRFDHDPVTLASRGLLIEASRTNTIPRSQDFSSASWVKSNLTVSGTLYTDPSGTSTANELVENTTSAGHTCAQSAGTANIGTTYTFSVFVKRKETSNQFLLIGATNLVAASFLSVNLTNGVTATGIGSPGVPINVSSTAYPNGWYRVQFSVVATSAVATTLDIRLSRDGTWANRSYLGDGVQSSLIWGAQVEVGSFPTSYIPTTTSALARSADVCSITGANFTSTNFYNPSAGTIIAIGSLNTTNTNSAPEVFKFNDGTNNNRIQIGMTNVSTEAIRPFIIASGSLTYNSTTGTATIGVERKIGTGYSTNDAISVFNGTLGTQDTTVTIPTGINQALIGLSSFTGTISSIRYFKKRLPNAKLQAITA